jgi:hypothetical protein
MKVRIEDAPLSVFVAVEDRVIAVDQIAYATDTMEALLPQYQIPLIVVLKSGTRLHFKNTTVREFAELLGKVASVT